MTDAHQGAVDAGQVLRLRAIMHELSNVMTGMLISGGLLRDALRDDPRRGYAVRICEAAERGAALVRESREICTPGARELSEMETACTTM